MSSTAYRDWTSRRWRPTLAEPVPAAAKRAKQLACRLNMVVAALLALSLLQVVIGLASHHGNRPQVAAELYVLVAMLVASAPGVLSVLWLYWRLPEAEAGGVSR